MRFPLFLRRLFNRNDMKWVDPRNAFCFWIYNYDLSGRNGHKVWMLDPHARAVTKPEHTRLSVPI